MPNIVRTQAELLALFADNNSGDISAQDMRDFVVTVAVDSPKLSSLDGVSNNNGNIDLIAGSGIVITPNNLNKTITFSSSGGPEAGVSSLNTLSGDLEIVSGLGVSINLSEDQIEIVNEGVRTINDFFGDITIEAGDNVTIDEDSETGTFTINSSGSGGVSSFNGNTGAIVLNAGDNITIDEDEEPGNFTIYSSQVFSTGNASETPIIARRTGTTPGDEEMQLSYSNGEGIIESTDGPVSLTGVGGSKLRFFGTGLETISSTNETDAISAMRIVLTGVTSDDTPTTLYQLNDSNNAIIFSNSPSYLGFSAYIIGSKQEDEENPFEGAYWELKGSFSISNEAINLVGPLMKTVVSDDSDGLWDVTAEVYDAEGNLTFDIKVTGEVGKNISWACTLNAIQLFDGV